MREVANFWPDAIVLNPPVKNTTKELQKIIPLTLEQEPDPERQSSGQETLGLKQFGKRPI